MVLRNLPQAKVKEIVLFLLFLLLAFENVLQDKISLSFSYLDEGSAVFLAVWAVASAIFHHKKGRQLNRSDAICLVSLAILCIVGFTGNVLRDIQVYQEATIIDFFTCIKFAIAFISSKIILNDKEMLCLLDMCVGFAKVAVIILLLVAVANQFMNLGFSLSSRFGIGAFQFLFGHPSNFAATIVGFVALLLLDPKKNAVYIICAFLLLALTTRIKAIGLVLVLSIALLIFPGKERIPKSFVVMAGLAVLAIAYEQIGLYYLNDGTARSVLLSKSFEVANMFFPTGAGFASYGSNITRDFYPAFYYYLGFDHVHGLTPLNSNYLVDSFWPIIIGQFGWLGLILFLTFVVSFFRSVLYDQFCRRRILWASLTIPIYLLIASSSESAFFSSYSVYLAFTLVLILMGNATIEESCSIARKRSNSTAIKEGANSYGIEKHLADR